MQNPSNQQILDIQKALRLELGDSVRVRPIGPPTSWRQGDVLPEAGINRVEASFQDYRDSVSWDGDVKSTSDRLLAKMRDKMKS